MPDSHAEDQQAAKRILKKYLETWAELVDEGACSELSGVERCTLEIAFRWVCENFTVTEK